MHVSIDLATESHRPILANLIQFYLYEFTSFKQWDVGHDGSFGDYGLDDCWTTNYRHPFLIRVDGNLAGFAIVDGRSHLTGDPNVWDVAEFFVMRRYQVQGVGEHVARNLFNRFRGRWEVRQLAGNDRAIAFWQSVIRRYTDDRYTDVTWDDSRWRGQVQSFVNSPCTEVLKVTDANQSSGDQRSSCIFQLACRRPSRE